MGALYRQLEEGAKKYRENDAFAFADGTTTSFQRYMDDILRCYIFFKKQEQKRIAILGLSSYDWLCHAFGAALAGKTVIAADPLLAESELTGMLQVADTEAVLLAEQVADLSDCMKQKGLKVLMMNQMDTITAAAPEWKEPEEPEGEFILFTSGTTGQAKATVFDTVNFSIKAQITAATIAYDLQGKIYVTSPLHHIGGLEQVLNHQLNGNCVMLGNIRKIQDEIQTYRPKVIGTVPSVLEYLIKHDLVPEETECFISVGSKCSVGFQDALKKRGIRVQNFYGSTEIIGAATANLDGDPVDAMTPEKGIKLHIIDGELCIETENHFKEYYKREDATREKFTPEGYVKTGDLGYLDEKGRFHFSGRKDDVIPMKNGDKLSTLEVDEALSALPGVEEAAIIYVDETLIAVLVRNKSTSEELIQKEVDEYNKNQPVFRKIKKVMIRKKALPRSAAGKLLRWKLEKEYETI